MRLSCPSCHAELTLDVLMQHEAARRAVARLAQVSLPFGALTLQYMALFKPASRALSIDRMVRLIEELLPDIEAQTVRRNGREWDAGIETWRAALQVVLDMRDAGNLRLPLTGHGLLHQVIANMAEKVEADRERRNEQQRRQRSAAGPRDAGPRDLAQIAADSAAMPLATTTPPPAYTQGPSRAARELQARIAAARQARDGTTATDPASPDGAPTA
jgi:hypothetical protein